MLTDAIVLAFLSTVGLVMLFRKLPRKIRKFLQKHAIFTDFLTFLLTYFSLGSTLTALTAGAIVGIMTSILIYIADNPDDFLFIYDAYEYMKKFVSDMKQNLTEYSKQYREAHHSKSPLTEAN